MPHDYEVWSRDDILHTYGYTTDDGEEWTLTLDRYQVVPDDPGAGTPAMLKGPGNRTATYWYAYHEGATNDGEPIPEDVCNWLDALHEDVEAFLWPKEEQPAEPDKAKATIWGAYKTLEDYYAEEDTATDDTQLNRIAEVHRILREHIYPDEENNA